MVKKIEWFEQDDQQFSQIQRDRELTEEYNLLEVTWSEKNNGKVPGSRLDQGRNCPNCAGRLFHKGELASETPLFLLRCNGCGREFFAEVIDNPSEIVDQFYRTIPKSMQLKWNEHRKNYRKRGAN